MDSGNPRIGHVPAGSVVLEPAGEGPEVERVLTACVFAVATGRWKPGEAVPSVRRGAEEWGVAPATVHQAYRVLVERGMLRSEARRGYFVRDGAPVRRLLRDAASLEGLYARVRELVEAQDRLSPLGIFRHLLRRAEADARARPEVGFVECTLRQARRHAAEIESRLGIPCAALVLEDVAARRVFGGDPRPDGEGDGGPATWVRLLATTAFHEAEVRELAGVQEVGVQAVPLACSAAEVRSLARGVERLEILSFNRDQGRLVAADIRMVLGSSAPSIHVRGTRTADLDRELEDMLGSPDRLTAATAVVMSMFLWDALSDRWRATKAVHPYPYRIAPDAWGQLAEALGVPLGT